MLPLIIGLILGVLEWASAIEFYKMFLYEETIQMGTMTQFVFGPMLGTGKASGLGEDINKFGTNPGIDELDKNGFLIPWAIDCYSCFFWTALYTNATM